MTEIDREQITINIRELREAFEAGKSDPPVEPLFGLAEIVLHDLNRIADALCHVPVVPTVASMTRRNPPRRKT